MRERRRRRWERGRVGMAALNNRSCQGQTLFGEYRFSSSAAGKVLEGLRLGARGEELLGRVIAAFDDQSYRVQIGGTFLKSSASCWCAKGEENVARSSAARTHAWRRWYAFHWRVSNYPT